MCEYAYFFFPLSLFLSFIYLIHFIFVFFALEMLKRKMRLASLRFNNHRAHPIQHVGKSRWTTRRPIYHCDSIVFHAVSILLSFSSINRVKMLENFAFSNYVYSIQFLSIRKNSPTGVEPIFRLFLTHFVDKSSHNVGKFCILKPGPFDSVSSDLKNDTNFNWQNFFDPFYHFDRKKGEIASKMLHFDTRCIRFSFI